MRSSTYINFLTFLLIELNTQYRTENFVVKLVYKNTQSGREKKYIGRHKNV